MCNTYTEGSIISMIPAHGFATLTLYYENAAPESERVPLIGYAVVVVDCERDGRCTSTNVVPVVIWAHAAYTTRGIKYVSEAELVTAKVCTDDDASPTDGAKSA